MNIKIASSLPIKCNKTREEKINHLKIASKHWEELAKTHPSKKDVLQIFIAEAAKHPRAVNA